MICTTTLLLVSSLCLAISGVKVAANKQELRRDSEELYSYDSTARTLIQGTAEKAARVTFYDGDQNVLGELTWDNPKMPDSGLYHRFTTSSGRKKWVRVGERKILPEGNLLFTIQNQGDHLNLTFNNVLHNSQFHELLKYRGSMALLKTKGAYLKISNIEGWLCQVEGADDMCDFWVYTSPTTSQPTTTPNPTTLDSTTIQPSTEPSTTDAGDMTETTKPSTTEADDKTETTEPSTTEADDKTETTKPSTTEADDKTETTKPSTTEADDKTEATEPSTTEADDKVETTEPSTTDAGDMDKTTKPSTTEADDKTETTEPSTTEADDKTETTKPSTTETDDNTETTEPSTTDAGDKTETSKPSTTEADDKNETTEPSTTDADDKTETTEPSTTEADDKTETTEPSTTEADDKTETTEPSTTEADDKTETTEAATADTDDKTEATEPEEQITSSETPNGAGMEVTTEPKTKNESTGQSSSSEATTKPEETTSEYQTNVTTTVSTTESNTDDKTTSPTTTDDSNTTDDQTNGQSSEATIDSKGTIPTTEPQSRDTTTSSQTTGTDDQMTFAEQSSSSTIEDKMTEGPSKSNSPSTSSTTPSNPDITSSYKTKDKSETSSAYNQPTTTPYQRQDTSTTVIVASSTSPYISTEGSFSGDFKTDSGDKMTTTPQKQVKEKSCVSRNDTSMNITLDDKMICDGIDHCVDRADETGCPIRIRDQCYNSDGSVFYDGDFFSTDNGTFGVCKDDKPLLFLTGEGADNEKVENVEKHNKEQDEKISELENVIETMQSSNQALKHQVNELEDVIANMTIEFSKFTVQIMDTMRNLTQQINNNLAANNNTNTSSVSKFMCTDNDVSYDGFCYVYNQDTLDYNSARSFCKKKGGDLASWSYSQNVQRMLLKKAPSPANVWIGARFNKESGTTEWTDGTEFNIKITRSNGATSCGALYKKMVAGFKCSNKYSFWCKYSDAISS